MKLKTLTFITFTSVAAICCSSCGTTRGQLTKLEVTKMPNKLVYTVGEKKHTRIVFDDLAELFELLDNECAFMSPISYFGRNRTAKNAAAGANTWTRCS